MVYRSSREEEGPRRPVLSALRTGFKFDHGLQTINTRLKFEKFSPLGSFDIITTMNSFIFSSLILLTSTLARHYEPLKTSPLNERGNIDPSTAIECPSPDKRALWPVGHPDNGYVTFACCTQSWYLNGTEDQNPLRCIPPYVATPVFELAWPPIKCLGDALPCPHHPVRGCCVLNS